MIDLTKRIQKGSPLTKEEHDENLDKIEQAFVGVSEALTTISPDINSYDTYAEMIADVPVPENYQQATVSSDSDNTKNGGWSGFGGVWIHDSTKYNYIGSKVNVKQISDTTLVDTGLNGISFENNTTNLTKVIFNETYSKYLKEFAAQQGSRTYIAKIFNKTKQISVLANINALAFTDGSNIYYKADIINPVALANFSVNDAVEVFIDLDKELLKITDNPIDAYYGNRLEPASASDGLFIQSADNKAIGYLVKSNTNIGNGHYAGFVAEGEGNAFENSTVFGHYGAMYWITYLRNNSVFYGTNDMYIIGGKNSSKISFRLGNTAATSIEETKTDEVLTLKADKSIVTPQLAIAIIDAESTGRILVTREWVIAQGFITGPYDNYGSWKLYTNGMQRTTIGSGEKLDLVAGTNISLSYGAGGVVTINCTAGGGNVSKSGTPVDNQIAVWTGDGILEGTMKLTFDGSTFELNKDADTFVKIDTTNGLIARNADNEVIVGSGWIKFTRNRTTASDTIVLEAPTGVNATITLPSSAGILALTSQIPTVEDTTYGASWNGNTNAATKNAIYDKIETLGSGGASTTTADTGVNISLANNKGNFCNMASANSTTAYALTGAVAGGWAKVLINATSEPTVTGATKELGSSFVPSTDMYLVVYNNGTASFYYFIAKTGSNKKEFKSITIPDPVATDDATLFFTPVAITVSEVRSHIAGTTNVVFNIGHAATRTGTQLDVFTSDITLTSTAGQSNNSGFNDATIPANSWVWLDIVSISDTPTFFHATIIYSED